MYIYINVVTAIGLPTVNVKPQAMSIYNLIRVEFVYVVI